MSAGAGGSSNRSRLRSATRTPEDQGTSWILWLNDDYQGGRIFWPTREIVLEPVAGTAVRWPSGIPHGIELTYGGGYQFTLEARNVAEPAPHDRRIVLTDE